jgi:hypothetical protein
VRIAIQTGSSAPAPQVEPEGTSSGRARRNPSAKTDLFLRSHQLGPPPKSGPPSHQLGPPPNWGRPETGWSGGPEKRSYPTRPSQLAVWVGGLAWRSRLAESLGGPPQLGPPPRIGAGGVGWRCLLAVSVGGLRWRCLLADRPSWGHPPDWGWRCRLAVQAGGVRWRCPLAVSVGGVRWRCRLADRVTSRAIPP